MGIFLWWGMNGKNDGLRTEKVRKFSKITQQLVRDVLILGTKIQIANYKDPVLSSGFEMIQGMIWYDFCPAICSLVKNMVGWNIP